MTAPTREALLREVYDESWYSARPAGHPDRAALIAVVLAAIDSEREEATTRRWRASRDGCPAPESPWAGADVLRVGDDEAPLWCLERWDSWALSLVGYEGRTIESVGRVNLRASIRGLVQMGLADPQPSAPTERPTAMVSDAVWVSAHAHVSRCAETLGIVPGQYQTKGDTVRLMASVADAVGEAVEKHGGPLGFRNPEPSAAASEPGLVTALAEMIAHQWNVTTRIGVIEARVEEVFERHGRSTAGGGAVVDELIVSIKAAAASEPGPMVPDAPGLWWRDVTPGPRAAIVSHDRAGALVWSFVGDAGSHLLRYDDRHVAWLGPVVHPGTVAAQRVQDAADSHAEVEELKRELATRTDQRNGWELAAQNLEGKASELARTVKALKAQSLADNAAVRSTYHHVVKCAGQGDQAVGEELATLQEVCAMTGVLVGEMAHERKALEVALDIERGGPMATLITPSSFADETHGPMVRAFVDIMDDIDRDRVPSAANEDPVPAPSPYTTDGAEQVQEALDRLTVDSEGYVHLNPKPSSETLERPDKATALLLARLLTNEGLDNLAAEFDVAREPENPAHVAVGALGPELDVALRRRLLLAIEASE